MSSKGCKHFPIISIFVLQKNFVPLFLCVRVKKMQQAFLLSGFLFVIQFLCGLYTFKQRFARNQTTKHQTPNTKK